MDVSRTVDRATDSSGCCVLRRSKVQTGKSEMTCWFVSWLTHQTADQGRRWSGSDRRPGCSAVEPNIRVRSYVEKDRLAHLARHRRITERNITESGRRNCCQVVADMRVQASFVMFRLIGKDPHAYIALRQRPWSLVLKHGAAALAGLWQSRWESSAARSWYAYAYDGPQLSYDAPGSFPSMSRRRKAWDRQHGHLVQTTTD